MSSDSTPVEDGSSVPDDELYGQDLEDGAEDPPEEEPFLPSSLPKTPVINNQSTRHLHRKNRGSTDISSKECFNHRKALSMRTGWL